MEIVVPRGEGLRRPNGNRHLLDMITTLTKQVNLQLQRYRAN